MSCFMTPVAGVGRRIIAYIGKFVSIQFRVRVSIKPEVLAHVVVVFHATSIRWGDDRRWICTRDKHLLVRMRRLKIHGNLT